MARERTTKVSRRGDTISIRFGSSRADQVAAANFISRMAGRPPLDACPTCGGLPPGSAQSAADCVCSQLGSERRQQCRYNASPNNDRNALRRP